MVQQGQDRSRARAEQDGNRRVYYGQTMGLIQLGNMIWVEGLTRIKYTRISMGRTWKQGEGHEDQGKWQKKETHERHVQDAWQGANWEHCGMSTVTSPPLLMAAGTVAWSRSRGFRLVRVLGMKNLDEILAVLEVGGGFP